MATCTTLPMEWLEQELTKRFPAAKVSLDRPRKTSGLWFLDITLDDHNVAVQWQQGKNFGVSAAAEHAYGEGPDEIYPTEEAAYGRVLSLLLSKTFTSPPLSVSLKELRKEIGLSQAELAEILNKQQGEISKIERRKDFFMSTLTDYVRAIGGELQITVRLADGKLRMLQLEDSPVAQSSSSVASRQ